MPRTLTRRELALRPRELEVDGCVEGILRRRHPQPRRMHVESGYWIAAEDVEPVEVVALGDLLSRHAEAEIELRIVKNLWPLWDRVIASTVEYSGIRLRNARSRP